MHKGPFAVVFLAFCSLLAAQQALNNDSLVKLVQAGLSDDLIIASINSSPGNFDTSADGLIALKKAGVSEKIVAAAMAKNAAIAATTGSAIVSSASAAQPVKDRPSGTPTTSIPRPPGPPRIFVKAETNFGVALAAALNKKHAPAIVVLDADSADYVLQAAPVNSKQESSAGKVARCLFAYCSGIEGTASVSVQLIRSSDGAVVWAYQVRKGNGGPNGIQPLSEAIAKHLKNEFLKHQ